MANKFIIKHGFHSKGNAEITGSLSLTNPITGSNILLTSSIINFNTEVSKSAASSGFGGGGGGSTSPGGSNTQVQFNDGGSFGGDAGFTYNKTTNSITGITHITSSGNISSSANIIANTGSFNRIIGTVANSIFTLDFTSGQLSTRLYAPYNLSIDSVTNVLGSPTTSITSSGSPYTLGNAITVGTPIDVTASVSSVINLNITR